MVRVGTSFAFTTVVTVAWMNAMTFHERPHPGHKQLTGEEAIAAAEAAKRQRWAATQRQAHNQQLHMIKVQSS